jgi:hypothetical protein
LRRPNARTATVLVDELDAGVALSKALPRRFCFEFTLDVISMAMTLVSRTRNGNYSAFPVHYLTDELDRGNRRPEKP